jgi:ABC-type glycerol-3-phosphate transport system substrate-binding protein
VPRVRRRALLAAAAALASGAAASLLGATTSVRASRPPLPPLTLLVGSGEGPTEPPFAAAAAAALVRVFERQERAAHVQVRTADTALTQLATRMLAGARVDADLLLVPPAVRDLPDVGILLHSLTPTVRATGIARGVYPSLLAYSSLGRRLLSAPLFRDPLVVYYNVDAFARAGIPPLPGAWTLAGFQGVCRALQAARGDGVPHALANACGHYDPELVAAFLAGFGASLTPSELDGLASEHAVEAFQALVALHPFEPDPPAASPRDLFAQAGAAMYFGHQRDLTYLSAAIGDLFAWNVAALPRFPRRAAVPVQAQGLGVITPATARRPAATALALFGLTRAAQLAVSPSGAGVPSLEALAGSPLWRVNLPAVDLGVFVRHPEADLVVPPAFSHLGPLQAALQRCLRGISPAEALAAAREAIALAPWGP